jgi:hypothetical protein
MIGAVIQLRSLHKALGANLSGPASLRQRHPGILARLSVLLIVAGLVLGMLPGENAAALPAAAGSPTPTLRPTAAARTGANAVRPAAAAAPFVAGTVWDDTTIRNGIFDDNEVGLPGVVVTIERVDVPPAAGATAPCPNAGPTVNPPILTTTTDADGRYRCDNLPAGTYRITVTIPEDFESTTPRQRTVIATVDGGIANFGLA